MITKSFSLVLLITVSTAASATTMIPLSNLPLSVYLLSIGSCAFIFLRKAVSSSKESNTK